ncbi:MAG: transcription-repair coupling factor, partial [Marinilabiliales bacterium]
TEERLIDFEKQLKDRFGTIPSQTIELMNVVRLRWLAIELGFEKIILKNKKLVAYFIQNQDSAYYKSPVFSKVLSFVQQNPRGTKMKESNNKLTLSFDNTVNIQSALEKFQKIIDIG